jgi:glutathione S-transferase
MKLYGNFVSPFFRMCVVTAIEAGIIGRMQLVDTEVKPGEVNASLEKLSPIGKIPVLETDHHRTIYDSRVIMEYLLHVSGNKSLLPDDGVKRFRILTLLALAQGLGDAAVGLRYELAARPEGTRWQEWAERARARLNAGLDDLDRNWAPLLADLNLGSIATAVVLSYIDHRHEALSWRKTRPGLAAFHAGFLERPSMTETSLSKA